MTLKNAAIGLAGVAAVGAAAFYNGYGASLIAQAGMNALAANVLVCAMLGLTAVAAIAGLVYVANQTYKYFSTTDQERYNADLAKQQENVNQLKQKLVENEQPLGVFEHFAQIIENAEAVKFDDKGKRLDQEQQPTSDKLHLMQWEQKKLKKLSDRKDKPEEFTAYHDKLMAKNGPKPKVQA